MALKENPYYHALLHPRVYMLKIARHTMMVGACAFLVNWLYANTWMSKVTIPGSMHSMVGFVIAMLLVFRTNTAYDRWWEGRKKFTDMCNSLSFMVAVYGSRMTEEFRECMVGAVDNVRKFLSDKSADTPLFHRKQVEIFARGYHVAREDYGQGIILEHELNQVRVLLKEFLDASNACERIKNTPIPFAYYIHIKLSVLVYLVTMPFAMFSSGELNMWSVPVIMVLYFMVSGIDVISNEIENPFSGEPNDLPVEELTQELLEILQKTNQDDTVNHRVPDAGLRRTHGEQAA